MVQGPTSSGKTSLVAFLAAQTGHTLVRINNHEQTDLQESLGSYISDERGRLVFREGALVQAVRQGHWLLLDELNLAPSQVLEALNRWLLAAACVTRPTLCVCLCRDLLLGHATCFQHWCRENGRAALAFWACHLSAVAVVIFCVEFQFSTHLADAAGLCKHAGSQSVMYAAATEAYHLAPRGKGNVNHHEIPGRDIV